MLSSSKNAGASFEEKSQMKNISFKKNKYCYPVNT